MKHIHSDSFLFISLPLTRLSPSRYIPPCASLPSATTVCHYQFSSLLRTSSSFSLLFFFFTCPAQSLVQSSLHVPSCMHIYRGSAYPPAAETDWANMLSVTLTACQELGHRLLANDQTGQKCVYCQSSMNLAVHTKLQCAILAFR